MQDIDRMIEEALDGEEQALFRDSAREPGYLEQAMGAFGGRTGWTNLTLMIVQSILFVAGVWTAWRFFQADDVLSALRWGLPAGVLLLGAIILKTAVMPAIQANRVIRQLKRLELQLAVARRP